MGLYDNLIQGYEPNCNSQKKYIQKIVLINKYDVIDQRIIIPKLNINGVLSTRNRIYFRLRSGVKGKEVVNIASGFNIGGSADASENEYTEVFTHTLRFIVNGYDEQNIYFLKSINKAKYFAAALINDGTVVIYGFDNCLHSSTFRFDVNDTSSNISITLQSGKGEEEYYLPLIYASNSSTPKNDFDNLFSDVPDFSGASFNKDFNNDFDTKI